MGSAWVRLLHGETMGPDQAVWSIRAVRANAAFSAAMRAARTSGGPMNAWLLV